MATANTRAWHVVVILFYVEVLHLNIAATIFVHCYSLHNCS